MQIVSKIYPEKIADVQLLLYGVKIEDLKTFTSIVKTDKELCIKKFKAFFKCGLDGYDEQTLEDAFNSVPPLTAAEIFSDRFSNTEVRAAIIRYCNPEAIFSELKHNVIDKITLTKNYPRIKIRGQYGKPDSSLINNKDVEVENIERKENYELLEITDKRILEFLPWGNRSSVIVLKMQCPSSKKDYYEYIDKKALKFKRIITVDEEVKTLIESRIIFFSVRKEYSIKKIPVRKEFDLKMTGEIILQALAWQMRRKNGASLTVDEYLSLISET